MELSEIRKRLDDIDRRLKEDFCARLACSGEVAKCKLAEGAGLSRVFDPVRESEILARTVEGLPERIARAVRDQFSQILRNSRSLQYLAFSEAGKDGLPRPEEPAKKSRVLLQGAAGAYQHSAAQTLFPDLPVVFCERFEDVFEGLDGESAGVLPLENSTAGVVGEVFDALDGHAAFVNGGLELKLAHTLMGLGDPAEVDTVLAHPQTLRQCENFLKSRNLRGEPCANNAIAARTVAERKSARYAALCAETCAALYGLKIFERGICDAAGNTTRFIVLGTRFERVAGADKLALLFRTQNRPGALSEALAAFSFFGVNVLALHSRPIKETPFEYRFYAEISGSYEDPVLRALLAQLSCELPYFRILGTF